MLNTVMLSAVMLSAVMPNARTLSMMDLIAQEV
jgi:hypothetical protein